MHGGHEELEGQRAVRRFAWQIGGLGVAVAAVVCLGVLAFGCGSAAGPRASAPPTPSVRATATVDPRVAAVDAAVRRYVQALADAMRTGSPDELGSLSVPGSQAQGNAGVAAHVVHDTGRCFVVMALSVNSLSISLAGSSAATAAVAYTLTGYDASFPSLQQIASARTVHAQKQLELELVEGRWLVSVEQ
jgi:hypothetical protein